MLIKYSKTSRRPSLGLDTSPGLRFIEPGIAGNTAQQNNLIGEN